MLLQILLLQIHLRLALILKILQLRINESPAGHNLTLDYRFGVGLEINLLSFWAERVGWHDSALIQCASPHVIKWVEIKALGVLVTRSQPSVLIIGINLLVLRLVNQSIGALLSQCCIADIRC